MQGNKKTDKPKFSISNLASQAGLKSLGAAFMAIFLGLVVGFIIMLVARPENAISGFRYILLGGMGRLGDVLYFATPILMTGLSVGFAFKMGLFNIGASGQYTMGMYFALYVAFMWDLPGSTHWIVAILAGFLGGMIWGFIPGILKALLNVNEVITSIMFNYIGMYLVDMWIQNNGVMYNSSMTRTRYIDSGVQIPSLGIIGSNVNLGIILAIIIAVILYIVLEKTTFGYELKATGHNKYAAEYAGMKGKRNIILTMVIAGGMAGIGGAFAILAPSAIAGSSMTYEPINIIAANGFTGIAVALLGNAHPLGTILSATFISYIQRGGTLTSLVGFKPEIIDIVIAVIIYFSAFAMIMNSAIAGFVKRILGKDDEKPIQEADSEKEEVIENETEKEAE
ncbi:ABC transporter permease [Gudongella sp. DL1XJH-153]|uniref:ABC transporter permease n=1 Tax=Gudongella sp. DL1XJH-153 TaxID=3409804 RepID=UPI003BB5D12A